LVLVLMGGYRGGSEVFLSIPPFLCFMCIIL
jgi:hypothetical protein